MDFLEWAKNRQLPSALKSRQGWAKLFEYHRTESPHIHQIEPTNFCQYNCIMCPRDKYMSREIGFMEQNTFRKIIDEVAAFPDNVKAKEIELFHFGESLFHPHIIEMIQYTSQSGLSPVLSINPANLTQQHIDLIPKSQPAKVFISLDSLNRETYREIRGSRADLDLAIQNAERLLKSCQKYHTDIVIRMIVMRVNHQERDHFQKFWEQRGGQVEFRDFFPWNKQDLKNLGRFKQYPPHMPCPFPWQYMVVHWNGDVVPCCRDCNGDMVLGNVIDQTLQEIWVSKEYEAFRERMMNGTNLPDCCKECLSLYYREK